MKKGTKSAALALAAVMMTAVLTACGSKADTASNNTVTDTAAGGSQAENTSAEAVPENGGTLTFGTNAEFPPVAAVFLRQSKNPSYSKCGMMFCRTGRAPVVDVTQHLIDRESEVTVPMAVPVR